MGLCVLEEGASWPSALAVGQAAVTRLLLCAGVVTRHCACEPPRQSRRLCLVHPSSLGLCWLFWDRQGASCGPGCMLLSGLSLHWSGYLESRHHQAWVAPLGGALGCWTVSSASLHMGDSFLMCSLRDSKTGGHSTMRSSAILRVPLTTGLWKEGRPWGWPRHGSQIRCINVLVVAGSLHPCVRPSELCPLFSGFSEMFSLKMTNCIIHRCMHTEL